MAGEADEAPSPAAKPRVIGRYALFNEIASGGMATVHLGRLVGPVGFSRTVAIKRLHPQFAKDPDFVSMFLDEARLASRIQHPNVVTTLDIVALQDEVFLVMEYVQGESLSRLLKNAGKKEERMPPGHVISAMSGVLHGLHAAHEAKSEKREALEIVHRDISPQNVLVGVDGVARVLDFGVAKAALRSQSTRDGQMKGKLSYMSPEQLNGEEIDRRTDVFAAGVILWEALCGKRLFQGQDAGEIFTKVLATDIPEPKSVLEDVPDELNAVVMKALERDIDKRYQTARDFAIDLEEAGSISTQRAVGEWVEQFAGPELHKRAQIVAEIESSSAELEDLSQNETSEPRSEPQFGDASESGVSGPRLRASRPSVSPRSSRSSLTGLEGEESVSVSQPSISSPSRVSSHSVSISGLHSGQVASPLSPSTNPRVWLAVLACVAGGLLAFILFQDAASDPEPPAAPPVAAPAFDPAETDERRSREPEDPNRALPTFSVDDLPAAEDEPDAAAEERKKLPPRRAAPRRAKKKTKKATPEPEKPEVNCNPPWTVDANGIRRLKPQCL